MNVKFAIQGSADKESVQNIAAVANQVARSLEGQYVNRVINLDTATAIIKVSGSSAIVIISTPSNGFAVHPRTGTYPTGANFDKVLPNGGYDKLPTEIINTRPDGSTYTTPITTMFPLYDDDKGTMAIVGEETEWESEVADPDNYGIHAWTSEDETVTWRGWPCRTIGCGRETSVEGVTQMDVQTAYNTFYTPLFGNIYVDGEAIPVPGKVRGAGISFIGKVFVSTVNYTQYDFAGFGSNEVNPDGQDWLYDNLDEQITDDNKAGKVGNYYDELYVEVTAGAPYTVNGRVRYATSGITNQDGASVDGWLRIGHRISQITNMSVWFSADGKSAVEDGGSWSWTFAATPNADKEVSQGTFTSSFMERTDTAEHEYTVYGAPNPWKVLGNTTWHSMYMLTKYGIVTYSRDDKTITNSIDDNITSDVPLLLQRRPDPTSQQIRVMGSTYNSATGETTFSIIFEGAKSINTISWSGATPDGPGAATAKVTIGEKVCLPADSIPSTVNQNVSAVDGCGFTASTTLSVNSVSTGQWIKKDPYSFPTSGCCWATLFGADTRVDVTTRKVGSVVSMACFSQNCTGCINSCALPAWEGSSETTYSCTDCSESPRYRWHNYVIWEWECS